ncbi:uncharacterized protein Z519_00785 [Cladophialophora bantiana CBS 173.52]|uniref:Enoyl reductase (ER) domain-containing protein n=1 Tax=Cladophialophora bantiana (strain ATCC 10958 / CBS 173.52 / CDC B-1940 / NIH 8579) TaxID=1442370 RepID=A0A0D2GL72_CLAB1|nr:uncharacterized protein Z519_00785 [Cladophialophora bantiana CBS 173.52]KIW99122.1 hypothetical protein Z519_00785 [Cladophialophora bantiana CBS 173.52]
MAATPTSTRTWILANHPKGIPTFSSSDENPTFKLVEQPLPPLQPNQVLVKVLFFSNDPAQRPAIDAAVKAERHYTAPVEIGQSMIARGLAEVIASTADNLPKGTIVQAAPGWTEYAVLNAADCSPRQPLPNGLSLTHYLGAFGGPGLTAYYGLVVIGEAKKGMRVVVSGAAGATGSMVVQIAKNIVGCSEVIGIAGSDAKCRWVESLGADKCLNYKSPTFEQDLNKATEGFVDIYFDNVGGQILDLMLARLKRYGVAIACGSISGYNSTEPTVLKNYFQVITMRLSIRGFIVSDYLSKAQETVQMFVQAVKDGKLKISNEESEQVVDTKFEDVPKTWLKLFEGGNTGKLVTKLV